MIPKIIHYCWFGGNELSDLAKKCIESWQHFCPEYEIRCWDESNYDVNKNIYMKETYQSQKWGFVPDYARLDIIYTYGGIYLDTDVELLAPLDSLLINNAFIGFEEGKAVSPGLMFGAVKGHPSIKMLMDDIYGSRHFINPNGSLNMIPSPKMNTDYLCKNGLKLDDTQQCVIDIMIYPSEYFCPKNYSNGEIHISANTISLHHFDGSWMPDEIRYKNAVKYKLVKFLPYSIANLLGKLFSVIRFRGAKGFISDCMQYIKKSHV